MTCYAPPSHYRRVSLGTWARQTELRIRRRRRFKRVRPALLNALGWALFVGALGFLLGVW